MTFLRLISKYKSYIVGGALRDSLLQKKIKDIDIVIITDESSFSNLIDLIKYNKYNIFPLDRERFIYRLTLDKNNLTVDISLIKDLETDIKSRDFTINSLAIELNKVKLTVEKNYFKLNYKIKDIIDLTGGIKDIKNKKIRLIHKKNIEEDTLRILRAYRFYATLNFEIERKTEKIISENSHLIKKSSPERIKDELIKIFETDNTKKTLQKMYKSGLLFTLFPELKLQPECAAVYYGKGGVLKHTLNVVERMDILYKKPKDYLNIKNDLIEKLKQIKPYIKIAGLFHDIAKPHTARVINGRLRFFGHDRYGAELTEKILKEYKFSNETIKMITTVIKHHLRIGNIAHNNHISDKTIMKIFYELKDYTFPLLILSWADHSSYISVKALEKVKDITREKPFEIIRKLPKTGKKKTVRFIQVVNYILKNFQKYSLKTNLKPVINGHTVMKTLNLKEGPLIGKILRKIIMLQFENKIKTPEEAIRYIKTLNLSKL